MPLHLGATGTSSLRLRGRGRPAPWPGGTLQRNTPMADPLAMDSGATSSLTPASVMILVSTRRTPFECDDWQAGGVRHVRENHDEPQESARLLRFSDASEDPRGTGHGPGKRPL